MPTGRVFFIEPNGESRASIARAFELEGISISSFASAQRFLSFWNASECREKPVALMMDMDAQATAAVAAFNEMRSTGLPLHHKVIFLSGGADLSMAVELMRGGAFDFLTKPCTNELLFDRVTAALFEAELEHRRLLDPVTYPDILTQRERQIAGLILQGLGNREIAEKTFLSSRTVEVHRAKMFEKLNVRNTVAFVRRLIEPERYLHSHSH